MVDRSKKKSNPMVAIIDEGISSVHSARNVLAKIWRILIIETNMTAPTWFKLLDEWQMRMRLRKTDKDASSLKGNITSALSGNNVTWEKLLVGFNIMGYVKADIHLTLYNKRGVGQEIKMSINIIEENMTEETENT